MLCHSFAPNLMLKNTDVHVDPEDKDSKNAENMVFRRVSVQTQRETRVRKQAWRTALPRF